MSNLLPYIKAVLFGRDATKYEQNERITMESVEAVSGQHHAQVHGVLVPITGLATVEVGEQVAVAWKNGVPIAVIKHAIRRAQFHGHFHKGGGIVEQLLVGNFDKTATDVWYRNGTKLVKVMVSTSDEHTGKPVTVSVKNHWALQGATPISVKWGLDGASFGVECTTGLFVTFDWFRDYPNTYDEAFPTEARFYWAGRPLEANTTLCTVSWTDKAVARNKWYLVEVEEKTGPWVVYSAPWYDGGCTYWMMGGTGATYHFGSSGEASASASAGVSETFTLQDALHGKTGYNGNGTFSGSVLEWFLDSDKVLKFTVSAGWDYYMGGDIKTSTGTGTMPFGAGRNGMDSWTFTVTCSSGRRTIGAKKRSDQSTVSETHLWLLDQNGAILWSTCAPGPQIGYERNGISMYRWAHGVATIPASPDGEPRIPGLPT